MKSMKTCKIQTVNRTIFWVADEHYWHQLLATKRGFGSVSAMNDVMIYNHNSVVGKKDMVIHVGDFSLGKRKQTEELFERLNGQHIVVPGDHDRVLDQIKSGLFEMRPPIFKVEIEGQQIVNCHYLMTVWPRSHYGSWHVYAHVHGHLSGIGKTYDAGVDNNNFYPISFEELKEKMKERPNNINYIRPEDRRQ